jgi:hypothetical protein
VSWERMCWEAGTFAGLAYALTQHVLRPLWLVHCESEFLLDRCAVHSCFNLISQVVCFNLHSRPFTWILGALYWMGASCRDRFARRQSAASGQPDSERVSVFLYLLFTLSAVGSERSLLHCHALSLCYIQYLTVVFSCSWLYAVS